MAGTMSGGRGGRRAPIVGINVTPMVDVVLVLLVIMMVSATYIVAQSLKVDLPKTSSSDGAAPQLATVTITRQGGYRWNDAPITESALTAELSRTVARHADVSLVVSADAGATHGTVVHVIDLAKVAGITHFAINVEQED